MPKAGMVEAEELSASATWVSVVCPATYTGLPLVMVAPVEFRAVNWSSVALPTEIPLDRLAKLIFFVSLTELSTMTRTSALSTEVNSVRSVIFEFAISLLDILGELLFVGHQ
jgi:hypothetical protein